MRAARDVQAQKAYVDLHRDRIDAALGAAMNALADARPEGPLTYLGRWLLEQGAKQGETPPVGEVDAQSEVPDAFRPLQKRAAEALGPIKPVAETDDKHAAKLPEALNTFKTLAKTEAIEAACARLHELELNVARDPDSKEAVDALGAQLVVVDQVMATEIKKRTEGVSDEAAGELVKACQTAIEVGNKDFQSVYGSVYNVIKSGDADGMAKYEAAVGDLDAAIEKPAAAEQRDEAGVAAVLFADAARVKSSFDVVVRELATATGAGLELAVLGAKKTGLKKTSRVVEKSALRPGEGRGRSKWVCDVVRAMLVATSMSAVGSIVRGLLALHEAGALRVVRIKDRFARPSAGGWRDLMVNFVIVGDPTRHVCEVQVVHEMMLTARKGLPGHAIYGIVRSAMELIESCGRERELRREAVRSMVAAGATDVELIGAFEDAWILEDPEWAAGVEGGRDGLGKGVLTVDKEEGRVCGLELSGKKWKGEALPASVARLKALRELTMRDCRALKSIAVLPESVTQIGEWAFGGCASLASITIPASVMQIGEFAFFFCKPLASITIPASVTQIGRQAFQGCASLASITIPESVTQIGEKAFLDCTSLASITLPASVTQISVQAFRDCASLASITIPESVTQIGGGAFFGCKSLASIKLPASVTQIDYQAFDGCASLASITIPESVTQIDTEAFKGCTSLLSITIPSTTLVDPTAFGEHTQVTFMALELIGASEDAWILEDPEWVAGMEGGRDGLGKAFSADKEGRVVGLNLRGKWKGEALPASVARLTALRKLKMRDCTSLKSVAVLPASVTQIGEDAFYGCKSLASITIPASVTQIVEHAFYGCTSLASITLPESVTHIGWNAFRDCTSLASITLPASVTQIGAHAFSGCTSLASITIPASVTQIGTLAFVGCTLLSFITIPSSTVVKPGAFSAHTQVTRA